MRSTAPPVDLVTRFARIPLAQYAIANDSSPRQCLTKYPDCACAGVLIAGGGATIGDGGKTGGGGGGNSATAGWIGAAPTPLT
jgi:hypothetical protein